MSAQTRFFSGTLILDSFSIFYMKIGIISTILICLIVSVSEIEEKISAEFYPLLLFTLIGGILMFSTTNLILMFISLEILSLSVYILVSIFRSGTSCAEAGLKYFILGGVAGAVFLMGSAYLFGFSGSLNLEVIQQVLSATSLSSVPAYFAFGILFVILTFFFKVGAFPFHYWLPDVYHGSLTCVTMFMASVVKLSVFAAFVRVIGVLSPGFTVHFSHPLVLFLGFISVLTMFFGAISAVTQSSLKRLLAYSSISHSGFVIVGIVSSLVAGTGFDSVSFYLMNYAFLTIGVFTVVMSFEKIKGGEVSLDDISGISKDYPYLSFVFCVLLFALAGFPPTSGFMAKYFVLSEAVNSDLVWLAIAGVLSSVISAYFYLKVVVHMYLKQPTNRGESSRVPLLSGNFFGMTVALLIVFFIGLSPQIFFDAVSSLAMAN